MIKKILESGAVWALLTANLQKGKIIQESERLIGMRNRTIRKSFNWIGAKFLEKNIKQTIVLEKAYLWPSQIANRPKKQIFNTKIKDK